ncbi:hypothetical protein BCR41DRAFT_314622 [Lobosporangium transversale]|uniref:Uncharacterized protein n=1 Tax=Lobosporangium transversale TaxID=64571 RepID=A0A1Y2G699_9FUNG|nr:hypothetical protein BCR41DRAFT_314622 [Lobosporangium transversale]ORY97120.1 hypothetical protein BCR41DRAFT_314622 [Lobosporangium transversale]|eukprot:XP_021875653.1 hypothetical protein BCR41DRAFT_314622 [Lobosporangium transversale]
MDATPTTATATVTATATATTTVTPLTDTSGPQTAAVSTSTSSSSAASASTNRAASTCSDSGRGGSDAGILVFSGGTACNSLVQLLQDMTPNVTYVLGISDNGGSTSEILRVLDGPAIGDIRSRLIRLIKPDPSDIGRTAIQELLGYRLPGHGDANAIKNEWVEIVEGTHRLWMHIPSEKKEVIRGFLIYIQSEILKRAHKRFSFANGSIGNFFLTGARMFFGSLESAIFLFAAITGITEPTRVIPVINTNHGIAIAALLKDGNTILGQCAISHPSLASSGDCFNTAHVQPYTNSASTTPDGSKTPDLATMLSSSQQQEDSFSTLRLVQNNIHFDKTPTRSSSLHSRITRLYYINEYGQEIFPPPNPKLLCALAEMETLVYSIGSLYTSIIPCLILKDVGRGIAESKSLKNKIFMLNGTNDRETPDYTALDFIWALTGALNYSLKLSGQFWPTEYKPSQYITHLIYLDTSEVHVDTWSVEKLGIECVPCVGKRDPSSGRPIYDEKHLNKVLESILDGTWSSSVASAAAFSSLSTTANSTRPSTPVANHPLKGAATSTITSSSSSTSMSPPTIIGSSA